MRRTAASCLMIGLLVAHSLRADETVTISASTTDDNGFLVHEVRSSYQSNVTQIRVLRPTREKEKRKNYPVIYVLPVEAKTENRYGDGLIEVKKLDLHNKFGVIFVAPTFSHLPWYADHPNKTDVRQETYFVQAVVPFIDRTYQAEPGAAGRLLLGFSKSGWGAWSLLLRHPDLFHKAVAWDAPLMMDKPGKYGSGDIFGTQVNFESYCIGKLLEGNAEKFQKKEAAHPDRIRQLSVRASASSQGHGHLANRS